MGVFDFDLDLAKTFNFNKPGEREALNRGLLVAGLGMLQGGNQGTMNNIATGALGGIGAYQDYLQQQQINAVRAQQAALEQFKLRRALEQQAAFDEYRRGLPPEQQTLAMATGQDYAKAQIPKQPTPMQGFFPSGENQVTPMTIKTPDGGETDFMQYQLQKAALMNSIPSYGEDTRLGLAQSAEARQQAEMGLRAQALQEAQAHRQRVELRMQEQSERQAAAAERAKTLVTPAASISAFHHNEEQLRKVTKALEAAKSNPDAFGVKNYIPFATQRLGIKGYKSGVDARDKVSKLGNIEVKDLSGSAVTPPEMKRQGPSYPNVTDDPEKIITNLENMRDAFLHQQMLMQDTFAKDRYKTPLESKYIGKPKAAESNGWKIEKVD